MDLCYLLYWAARRRLAERPRVALDKEKVMCLVINGDESDFKKKSDREEITV